MQNNQNTIVVQASCQDNIIEIPYTNGFSISRATLGIIVVSLDVAVVLTLIFSFTVLGHYENIEDKEINNNMLLTEYFAVVINDLPDHRDYGSVKELKALLWNHIERVISEEPMIKT